MKKLIIPAILLLIIGLPIYAFFIEPKRIVVHQQALTLNETGTSLKVAQLSDIHLKKDYSLKELQNIVTKTNQQKPDIVVFTGDLFDNYATYGAEIQPQVIELLSQLDAPLGKFAVWGNHDYGGGASRVYASIMAESGFQLLENTGTSVTLPDNQQFFVAGIDDSLLGAPALQAALAERPADTHTLLLSHEPDSADEAVGYTVDLILSGHSHGGQVKLPFYTIKNTMAEKYFDGRYQLDSQTLLYVNTGLGTTAISARFGVPPEIAIFNLKI